MSINEFKDLMQQASWDKHLKDSYTKCKAEHKSRIVPFGLKRKFMQEKMATLQSSVPKPSLGKDENLRRVAKVGNVAQTGMGGAGLVTGLISASAPMSAAGVALALPAAAITLYALPVILTAAAAGYKVYKASKAHDANVEIWNYWEANLKDKQRQPSQPLQPTREPTPVETMRWLSWFGSNGIGNMSQLSEKLEQAKREFDFRVKEVESELNKLATKINAENAKPAPQTPQDIQKKQATENDLKRQSDSLARRYIDLGKDYSYLQYRLERFQMYHDMLELTVLSVVKLAKIDEVNTNITTSMQQQLDTYDQLYREIARRVPYLA